MSSAAPNPSSFGWPDPDALRAAVAGWAETTANESPALLRVGYVGSFSPDGSAEETHLDVVLIVEATDVPPAERVGMWDLSGIPVPTQPLVYTEAEWGAMRQEGGWLARKLDDEAVWVYRR